MGHSPTDPYKVSEVELIYRSEVKASDRPTVNKSEIAHEIFRRSWDENKIELLEQFKIMLLNNKMSCLGISEIGMGGITSCVVDRRLIFATALKANATMIMLAHNHPSGNLCESQNDILLTEKLVEAGNILDIKILDHLILTKDGYTSMADKGLFP